MENLFGVSWVWWLLGTFGVAGTVALAIFAPTVLAVIWRIIAKLFQTRIGCAAIVGLLVFVAADIHRSRLDQAELEAQKAAFDLKQKQRDETVAADTLKAVNIALEKQKEAFASIDKDAKEFKDALPPVPSTGNPFAVGPDACRLRAIAGLACRRSEGPETVPTPRSRRTTAQNRRSK